MAWTTLLAAFFVGVFLVNGVPHFVQGVCGNRFQTPFARPPGVGESPALINVLWGAFNFAVGFGLMHWAFPRGFPPPIELCIVAGIGGLLIALGLAYHFGRVRRGSPHP